MEKDQKEPSTPPLRPRKRRLTWKLILPAGILAALLLFLLWSLFPGTGGDIHIPVPGSGGGKISIKSPRNPGSPGDRIILVMGVDKNYDSGNPDSFKGVRTDSMMLVRVSQDKNTVSVVSIPRDSKVYVGKGRRINKINAAYAIGGAELAVDTIERSFGIPVDNYLVINTQGIRELVDAVGGVDVYIEKPMKYRDRTAGLTIDFEPGQHRLSGEEAEGYLRFRHDELGDIGRVRRQQLFVSALARKMRNPWILTRLPQLVRLGNDYMDTDLAPQELLRLAWFGKDVNMDRIRVATLPGQPSRYGISYWVISPHQASRVLDRLILDSGAEIRQDPDQPIRVGIYYAPDLPEPFRAAVERRLQQQDFKIICKSTQKNRATQIIEHSRRVSDQLTTRLRDSHPALENARLIFAPVGTTFEKNACSLREDYTLIIGEDSRSQ